MEQMTVEQNIFGLKPSLMKILFASIAFLVYLTAWEVVQQAGHVFIQVAQQPSVSLGWCIIIMMLADTVMAMQVARKKTRRGVTSRRLSRGMGIKIIFYCGVLIGLHGLQIAGVLGDLPTVRGGMVLIMAWEFISLLENAALLGWKIPVKLMKFLKGIGDTDEEPKDKK